VRAQSVARSSWLRDRAQNQEEPASPRAPGHSSLLHGASSKAGQVHKRCTINRNKRFIGIPTYKILFSGLFYIHQIGDYVWKPSCFQKQSLYLFAANPHRAQELKLHSHTCPAAEDTHLMLFIQEQRFPEADRVNCHISKSCLPSRRHTTSELSSCLGRFEPAAPAQNLNKASSRCLQRH